MCVTFRKRIFSINIGQEMGPGNSLEVQWLRLRGPNAGGSGSIPGGRAETPRAAPCVQKQRETCGWSTRLSWARVVPHLPQYDFLKNGAY